VRRLLSCNRFVWVTKSFSFLLAKGNYMHFLFFVNRLQDIRTLKNRGNFNFVFKVKNRICLNSFYHNIDPSSFLIRNAFHMSLKLNLIHAPIIVLIFFNKQTHLKEIDFEPIPNAWTLYIQKTVDLR